MTRKAISPLIAGVLLVVFTIVISFLVVNFMTQYTEETTSTTSAASSSLLDSVSEQVKITAGYIDGYVARVYVENSGRVNFTIKEVKAYNKDGSLCDLTVSGIALSSGQTRGFEGFCTLFNSRADFKSFVVTTSSGNSYTLSKLNNYIAPEYSEFTLTSKEDWLSGSMQDVDANQSSGDLALGFQGIMEAETKAETLPYVLSLSGAVWDTNRSVAYIFGGYWQQWPYLDKDTIIKYTPSTGEVAILPEKLPIPTEAFAGTVWDSGDNVAYIFGGGRYDSVASTAFDQILRYDPATGNVTVLPEKLPYNISSNNFNSAVLDPENKVVYIFGGFTYNIGLYTDNIIRYNISSGNVTILPEKLPQPMASSALWDPVNKAAYIFGGDIPGGYSNAIIRYDPATGNVTTLAETLPNQVTGTSAVWDENRNIAYIFGNAIWAYSRNIIVYNPSSGNISIYPQQMPQDIAYASAAADDAMRSYYILGGDTTAGTPADKMFGFRSDYYPSGTFTAPAIDALRIAVWENITFNATIPSGTSIIAQIETSEDNVAFIQGSNITVYSGVTTVDMGSLNIPNARYARLAFYLNSDPGNDKTPKLHEFKVGYEK